MTLEPKVMAVLRYLAAHPGVVIPREELLEEIWADTIVTEETLTRCVSVLRRVFGDDPRAPQYIETIRKGGYRLIAEVGRPAAVVPATPRIAPSSRRRWPAWAVLGAGLVLLGLVVWQVPQAPPPPRLVTEPFTALPGNEAHPALSPDGNHVAFAWDRREGTHFDIYVQSKQASTPLLISAEEGYEFRPTWSPDGALLAFVQSWGGCTVYVVPFPAGTKRRLGACGGLGLPQLAWSPDGRWLALAERTDRETPQHLSLMDATTGEKHRLTTPVLGQRDHHPVFAADGQHLVFIRSAGRQQQLMRVAVAGGEPVGLRSDLPHLAELAGRPGTDKLFATSTDAATSGLWQFSPGGPAERLWPSPSELASLAVRGGEAILTQWSSETNLYRQEIAREAAPQRFAASTRWEGQPAISPDGARVAFVSDRTGQRHLWLSTADGSEPTPLTHGTWQDLGQPAWSPEGHRLLFTAQQDGHRHLFLLDLAGSAPQRLSEEAANHAHPTWSPDGRAIYFSSDRSGTWQIWRQPTEGGPAVQITQRGGWVAHPAPDGPALYFTRPEQAGLWQLPAGGGTAVQVPVALAPPHLANWAVTDSGIYFVRSEPEPHLAYFDRATQALTVAAALPGYPRAESFALAPRATWFLFAKLDRSESDLIRLTGLPMGE